MLVRQTVLKSSLVQPILNCVIHVFVYVHANVYVYVTAELSCMNKSCIQASTQYLAMCQ